MNGSVTLTGKLKFENQRIPLMRALRGVAGVRNVLDQLQVAAKANALRPGPRHGLSRRR